MRARLGLAFVLGLSVALAAAAPDAWAKPRLFTVSLSGEMLSSLSIDQTETRVPPDGCLGVDTETRSFDASARFTPLPRPRRAIDSWLLFHARMKAHKGSAASEVRFEYAPNPEAPWVDPSTCVVAPEREDFRCFFDTRATRRSGSAYALKPVEGSYRLIYRPLASMLDCGGITATFFGDYDVGLRVRAVMGLAKGRSVVRSGTGAPLRELDEWTPRESFRYRLKVTRVR